MIKKYKRIEYTGDMSNKDIAKEVLKQLYERDSAVDLFEKMKDLKITKDVISYGNFDIKFTVTYDGIETDLETDKNKDRKGKGQVGLHVNGAIFSDGTKVDDDTIVNILAKININDNEKTCREACS